MYKSFFDLAESPFENTLDQHFLFLSEDHQEVLAALLYFIETRKGFAIVCGDVGTGKTMLIKSLLDRLPDTIKPILISNPNVTSLDLLFYLAKTLEIQTTGEENFLELTDQIKEALLEAKGQDKHLVLIIDEAHLLSDQALEEIRLLSNIETPNQKLLQILLVGQYELSHKLDRPEMRHLRQRINVNRFLSHLNFYETIQYIDHRLRRVGSSFPSVFEDNCIGPLFKITKGLPRLINQLCDNALLISMAEGLPKVNRKTLKKAAEALQTDKIFTPPSALRKEIEMLWKYFKTLAPAGAGLALGMMIVIMVTMLWQFRLISHNIDSVARSLPETKARPGSTEIKEAREPSTGKVTINSSATKLAESPSPKAPWQEQEKGKPTITLPSSQLEIIDTATKKAGQGPPAVKEEGVSSPPVPEGVQKEAQQEEMPTPGTTPPGQWQPGGETPVKEPLPAPPAFEKLVTQRGETLLGIASRHYRKDPRFGLVGILLQNPTITNEDILYARLVLSLPQINFEKRTIQLKDNLWYALYGRYTSPESAKKIESWLTSKKIKFFVRDSQIGRGTKVQRIFIGGYATAAELDKALGSLTTAIR